MTSGSVDSGSTLIAQAEAAVRFSDNTAFNLVLASLGGPGALRDGLALPGDSTSEVAHDEPELNDVDLGSTDDTTTPAAFGLDLARLVTADHARAGAAVVAEFP